MKAIAARIGSREILIKTLDEKVESLPPADLSGKGAPKSPYVRTSAPEKARQVLGDAYSMIQDMIKDICEDAGDRFRAIDTAKRPKQVEMEFSVGVTVEGKLVIFNGEANAGVKVTLTW